MIFSFAGKSRLCFSILCAAAIVALPACNRAAARERNRLQIELRQALSEHSYEKALDLAARLVKLQPQNNGNWDRLVQAQFGRRDLAAVKQTLAAWRAAVKHPSPNLDEYAGDLAAEEHDPAAAIQAWSRVLKADRKNTRILEKIARCQQAQHDWAEENKTWTGHIAAHDSAMARVNRALCRRRLRRWEEALDDLHRAQQLSPEDPEVLRVGRLFDRVGKFLPEIRELDAALALTPNDAGLLADRALMFLRSEDFELALEDSVSASAMAPWARRPRLFQAIALLNLRRPNECEKLGVQKSIRLEALAPQLLETVSRLDSEISVERNNADLYAARAWQLNEIGQPALALEDAENATRSDAKSAAAHAETSYALTKLERRAEAFEEIKRATELDPNFSTAWQYRGELEMDLGQFLSAVDSLTRALERNETPSALQKREQCYRRLGLLVKAEQDRRKLEELNARAAR